ncbi:MAG: hypothetical protein JJE22_08245 [Bacteroidia bacterium]|nr:hypothetical protein [Bacteroidia bacterium]
MQAIKEKIKKVTATPKGRIIALSILIFLAATITGGIGYWNTYKKGIIKGKLESAIREKTNGLYKIKYDSLEMDEISGYLSVSNMHLAYDSNRYNEFDRLGKAPSILFDIQIPHIIATGVKTPRALIENEIVGGKLEINNPVIRIIYTNSGMDSSKVLPPKEVYEQILGNLDLIQADTVLITGAQIITGNLRTKDTITQIQDVSVTMMDVKVDSTSSTDTTRLLFAKKIEILCSKLAWPSANGLYTYSADSLSISSPSQYLHIKSFRIVPALNENAFANALPIQDDRFDFLISDIQMKNINMPQLFEQNIVADSILISSATFKIYRDLARPRDKKNRVGTYPQQVIQKLPVGFNIRKIIVANSFLEYKERSRITRKSGKVQYYNTYTSISNFTNDTNAIAANNVMRVDMSTRFLNKTPVKLTWLFYLLDPKGRFDVNGTCGAIDATALNPLTEPMGPAHIKRGHISGVSFNMHGYDYGMDGAVKMLYEDIHVTVLEKEKGSTELDERALKSFIANIMIKNSNPKKNEEPRVAQVHLDRDQNHSIFYLFWKTILKGLKETVGLKE